MRVGALVLFLFWCIQSEAQSSLKKVNEIKSKELTHLMVDRLGNFFAITKLGEVKKFDANGNLLARWRDKKIKPTLLEPWYHPAIFVYDQKNQTTYTFDRNFESQRTSKVEPSLAVQPKLICPRGDNRLLILDGADYSIKLINPLTNTVLSEFSIDAELVANNPKFVYLREYQNLIFLLDPKSGILILSNIGKLVNKIEVAGLNNFNFFGEEIYFIKNQHLQFFDLYTEEIRSIALPSPSSFALATDERIIVVTDQNRIVLYELPASLMGQKDGL